MKVISFVLHEEEGVKADSLYDDYVATGLISETDFNIFSQFSASTVKSDKYLLWMLRTYLSSDKDLTPDTIIDMVEWFNNNYRRFPGTDLYRLDWEQVENLYKTHGLSKRQQDQLAKNARTSHKTELDIQVLDKHDPSRNQFNIDFSDLSLIVDTSSIKIAPITSYKDAIAYNGVRDKDKWRDGIMGESWCIGRNNPGGLNEWKTLSRKSLFFYGWYNNPDSTWQRACIQVFPGSQIRAWDRNDQPTEIEKTVYAPYADLLSDYRKIIQDRVVDDILKLPHTKNTDGSYTIHGNLDLNHHGLRSFSELGIVLRKVDGSIKANYNYLKNLEGAPAYIGGDLRIAFNYLESLDGAPAFVGGAFVCSNQRSGKQFKEQDVKSRTKVRGYVEI